MLTHPLLPKLKELRLSGMVDTLDERAQLAQLQHLTPVDFLALLLDDEIDRRQQRKQSRLEHSAGFVEGVKVLADFDFGAIPTLDRSVILDLATCQFIHKKHNWLICGPTGVGKSHLATAIGYEAIRRGLTVVYAKVDDLLTDLYRGRADGSREKRMKEFQRCNLLILDDFGLRALKEQGADDMYEIIQARYERGSVIVTSNRSPAEWPDLFGNALLASAALDRLTHHARISIVTGESYRQRQRRQGRPTATPPAADTPTNEE